MTAFADLSPRERGERIKAERARLRFEERFYCLRDGRLLAGIVPYEGERYLWIAGGRDGHGRSLAGEVFEALAYHRANRETYSNDPDMGKEWYDRVHRNLLNAYSDVTERGGEDIEPAAHALNDPIHRGIERLRADFDRPDWPAMEYTAACPRCHRPTRLAVTPDGVSRTD